MERLVHWAEAHEALIAWLVLGSLGVFVITLLLIPVLVIRIPVDYFSNPGHRRSALWLHHPLLALITKALRNTLALVLIAAGLILLLLPGQGLLCIVLGLLLADFPGKHRLVNWLVFEKGVIKPINWLRRRSGKPPILNPAR